VTEFETVETVALERAHGIDASTVVAHVRVPAALVYVRTRVSRRCERVTVVTDALESAIEVRALTVPANPFSLVTLVNV